MRILRGTLPAILLLAALCAVAAGEAGATIIIPEGTELPEDIRNWLIRNNVPIRE